MGWYMTWENKYVMEQQNKYVMTSQESDMKWQIQTSSFLRAALISSLLRRFPAIPETEERECRFEGAIKEFGRRLSHVANGQRTVDKKILVSNKGKKNSNYNQHVYWRY